MMQYDLMHKNDRCGSMMKGWTEIVEHEWEMGLKQV